MKSIVILLPLILGTLACSDVVAQDRYSTAMDLAKTRFFEAETAFDLEIRDWLDKQEERARKRGDRDSVLDVKSKRDAYARSSSIPDGLSRVIIRQYASAKTRLKNEYESVISDLTRAGMDKRAAEAEKELSTLLTGTKPSIALFNGRDLTGWNGDARLWSVVNGTIIGRTPPGGVPNATYLFSKEQFGSFDLRCDVKLIGNTADSGLMFRNVVVAPNRFLLAGPQCNIGPGIWGDFLIQGTRSGPFRTKPLAKPDQNRINKALRSDDFNSLRVKCVGKQVTMTLNGQEFVNGVFNDIPDVGVIGFQLWPKSESILQIKNVRITKL